MKISYLSLLSIYLLATSLVGMDNSAPATNDIALNEISTYINNIDTSLDLARIDQTITDIDAQALQQAMDYNTILGALPSKNYWKNKYDINFRFGYGYRRRDINIGKPSIGLYKGDIANGTHFLANYIGEIVFHQQLMKHKIDATYEFVETHAEQFITLLDEFEHLYPEHILIEAQKKWFTSTPKMSPLTVEKSKELKKFISNSKQYTRLLKRELMLPIAAKLIFTHLSDKALDRFKPQIQLFSQTDYRDFSHPLHNNYIQGKNGLKQTKFSPVSLVSLSRYLLLPTEVAVLEHPFSLGDVRKLNLFYEHDFQEGTNKLNLPSHFYDSSMNLKYFMYLGLKHLDKTFGIPLPSFCYRKGEVRQGIPGTVYQLAEGPAGKTALLLLSIRSYNNYINGIWTDYCFKHREEFKHQLQDYVAIKKSLKSDDALSEEEREILKEKCEMAENKLRDFIQKGHHTGAFPWSNFMDWLKTKNRTDIKVGLTMVLTITLPSLALYYGKLLYANYGTSFDTQMIKQWISTLTKRL